jgi:predicted ester cyclase
LEDANEVNKGVVRRYIEEVLNGGRIELIDELFAPDMRAQVRSIATDLRTNFPDMHERIETLICEGDTVAAFWILTGTQRGEFFGIPPTGRGIDIAGMSTYYLRDGVIVDDVAVIDWLEAVHQLGATVKPPEA